MRKFILIALGILIFMGGVIGIAILNNLTFTQLVFGLIVFFLILIFLAIGYYLTVYIDKSRGYHDKD